MAALLPEREWKVLLERSVLHGLVEGKRSKQTLLLRVPLGKKRKSPVPPAVEGEWQSPHGGCSPRDMALRPRVVSEARVASRSRCYY